MPRAVAVAAAGLRRALVLALVAICAPAAANVDALAPFRAVDAAVVARVLALDPDRISAADVRDTLARVPAPHIIALSGSVAFVTMQPFAEFLAEMGYPRERLVNPRDGSMSWSSYVDSERLAGEIAWFYERDAMMPMLIGHSQGGMVALKTLHELAGTFGHVLRVWAPQDDAPQPRTTIIDPLTAAERPVAGLRVGYAAALATGKLPRVLLLQWSMLPYLRAVPDSVADFDGFSIPGDVIAGNVFGDEPYRATGTARVRNVALPASYSHIALPQAEHLPDDPETRAWIDAYVPAADRTPPRHAADLANLVHAADIWHAVKKRWCIEAQRALRAAQQP